MAQRVISMKLFYKSIRLSIRVIRREQFLKLYLVIVCLFGMQVSTAASIQHSKTQARSVNPLHITDFIYVKDDRHIDDVYQAKQLFEKDGKSGVAVRSYTAPFNVGNVDQFYWFYTQIDNDASDAKQLYLLAALPYRQLLNAYIIDADGVAHQILRESVDSVFDERNRVAEMQHRWQVSSGFMVPAKSAVTVLVQYHAMGSSYLPLEILDQVQLLQRIYQDSVSAALFYSFSVAAILLFLFFGIAMRDRTAVLYAALFALALLMLSAMEGFAFMYLWPEMPRWNHFSALVLIYLFCALGFYVAYKAVEPSMKKTRLPEKIAKLFQWLSILSLSMAALTPILPFVLVVDLTNLFVASMFIAHAFAILGWSTLDPPRLLKRNLIAIISAILIALVVIVLVLLSFDVSFIPSMVYVHSSRIIFILAGLATMATIITHISGMRQDYEHSLEQQVISAKREAEINRELFEAEQNYARVRLLASQRQQQLAEASHDMKQPLISLRSTFDAMSHDQSPQLKEQLSNAFSYLESLCSNYLDVTRPTDTDGRVDSGRGELPPLDVDGDSFVTEDQGSDAYEVNLVLETVFRMFDVDAKDKGIALRMVNSSVKITPAPTIVIRIIANLVSNAIKHAGQATILLGVRRRQGGVTLVVADNGQGIDPQMMQTVTAAYNKGPDSSGEGLGLAICKQLAEQHGMQLDISSLQGSGTCCQLHVSLKLS